MMRTIIYLLVFFLISCKNQKEKMLIKPKEDRFQKVTLVKGLDEPMELEILPNGNILFIERKGNIKLFHPKTEKLQLLTRLNIYHGHEDGLLGLALDPSFESNGWIYLFYSPPGDEEINRVSRFTLKEASLSLSSEKVIIDIPVQRSECCHSAGSLEFGPDGLLYIAIGDNTNPHNPGYYNSIDERSGREYWDAQRTAGNTNDLRGKILRIKPGKDGSYSIPEGNLFQDGMEKTRPEIFAMGVRNPYRISIDPKRNWLFWGDVGQNTKDDPSRGPISYDEFHLATSPGFFGWPYLAGNNSPYTHYDFTTDINGPFYKAEKPVNYSKNNTGLETLPAAKGALIWYSYDESDTFKHLKTGGKSPIAGPFYYSDDYNQKPTWADDARKFPNYYDGKVFFAEWMRDWINIATLTPEGKLDSIEQFLPSHKFVHPIDLTFGPDGALYVLEYGNNWFAADKNSGIYRIDYVDGNRKPTVKMKSDHSVGAIPLHVKFSSEGTIDTDKTDQLTYHWFFDQDEVQSNEKHPNYTFTKPGTYQVKLIVEDNHGAQNQQSMEILVGNAKPEISIDIKDNGSFYWNNYSFTYQINVKDKEDGSLEDGTISTDKITSNISYTTMYPDITMVSQEHENQVNAIYFHPGLELIKKSDCKSCHSEKEISIGPGYQAISQKYKKDPKALKYLTQKVIDGGKGNWGEVAMSAHPQLAKEEVEEMIEYILSLANAKTTTKNISVAGRVDVNLSDDEDMGSYIFSVTYQDKGANGIAPITTKKQFVLRPAKMKAVSCNDYDKVIKFNNQVIKFSNPTGYIMFENIDLTSINKISFLYSSQNLPTRVNIKIDSPDGETIGKIDMNPTLNKTGAKGATELNAKWENISTQIKEVNAKKDIYFIFEPIEAVETSGDKQCIIDIISFDR